MSERARQDFDRGEPSRCAEERGAVADAGPGRRSFSVPARAASCRDLAASVMSAKRKTNRRFCSAHRRGGDGSVAHPADRASGARVSRTCARRVDPRSFMESRFGHDFGGVRDP